MLTDTSVWVDIDRNRRTSRTKRLAELISKGEAGYTEPIAMELLAGSGETKRVVRILDGVQRVRFDQNLDFLAAGWLFRECAKRGRAPRGMIDCMIAAVAIRNEIPLLADDRDFAAIAEVSDLQLISS